MTAGDFNEAFENISKALSRFAELAGSLTKNPLNIPVIESESDDSEKRAALRSMLESLASAKMDGALSDEEIDKASVFFCKLYGGKRGYRHRYADICDLVLNALGQSKGDLDDGVPYSVNCLAENIGIIYENMLSNGFSEQAKSVLKLADHIDLEKTRLRHHIEQQKTLRDFENAIEDMRREREISDQQRAELGAEFDGRLDKTRMEYIAILGVFAAVVLAFNGGVGFTTDSISALGVGSGMRALVLVTALVGFVMLNTICILLVFLWKMSFDHRDVNLGKWPRNCLVTAEIVLIAIMVAMLALGHPAIRLFVGL